MNSNASDQPGWYEISIRGHLDERWSDWFAGMSIDVSHTGVTVLRGPVVDQAALHGLLARLRDLGTPLVSVRSIACPLDAEDPS